MFEIPYSTFDIYTLLRVFETTVQYIHSEVAVTISKNSAPLRDISPSPPPKLPSVLNGDHLNAPGNATYRD
jgi:hypothetical protein